MLYFQDERLLRAAVGREACGALRSIVGARCPLSNYIGFRPSMQRAPGVQGTRVLRQSVEPSFLGGPKNREAADPQLIRGETPTAEIPRRNSRNTKPRTSRYTWPVVRVWIVPRMLSHVCIRKKFDGGGSWNAFQQTDDPGV